MKLHANAPLGHRPPIKRLRELQGNNVAGIYS
jgi:hypothetical protein